MARHSSLGKHSSSPTSYRCSLVPSSANAENRERIAPKDRGKTGTPELTASQGDEIEKLESTNRRSTNPLGWFGILVPAALRRAQTSFKLAVSEEIPGLVNLIQEMQELEAKVVALRREIEERPFEVL